MINVENMKMVTVKFAIPKGSLEKATFKLLEESWTRVVRKDRTYNVFLDDPEIVVKMLRPQEIPTLVAEGLYDIGITGNDWIDEAKANVTSLLDLEYGKINLVVAFPDSFRFKNLDAMILQYAKKKKILRISSEYLTTSSKFIKSLKSYKKLYGSKDPTIITPWVRLGKNKNVQIHLSFGATEAKPPTDVDAIIDVTETGTTLRQNKLQISEKILESSAQLIVNKTSIRDKRKNEKIQDVTTLLRGAILGRKHYHIYLNVQEKNLKKVLTQLPSLKRPTISPLSQKGWYGINTIVPRSEFYKMVPKLRKLAQGLVIQEPKQILELDKVHGTKKN